MNTARDVIQSSVSFLISEDNTLKDLFYLDDVRINNDSSSELKYKETIQLSDSNPLKKIVLFNPNLNKRDEIISFRINTPNVEVYNSNDELIPNTQISLVWKNMDGGYLNENISSEKVFDLELDETNYELLFEAHFEPLSLQTFTIKMKAKRKKKVELTKVEIYTNSDNDLIKQKLNEFIKKR